MKKQKVLSLRAKIEKAVVSLNDNDAVEAIELFPNWNGNSIEYKQGDRLQYEGNLYKVRQSHTSQLHYTPDITYSLYEEIPKPGQGETPDNPIHYNNNMELKQGKYYIQDNVLYICIRDTGIAVYNPLSSLIGIYVEIYTG